MRVLFSVVAGAVVADTSMMKGAWLAPGGVGQYPGGYDLVAHFAGEPTWARAHYHNFDYPGDAGAKYKFFTVCGDSCIFDADFMAGYLSGTSMSAMCAELKSKGYNGIMYDFEIFHYTWNAADNQALNDIFQETKACGMYSAWTTAAMGPFEAGAAGSTIDIDWDQLDFVMPQMYDAHQNYFHNGLETYAPWWKNGGKSIHDWILAKPVGPNTLVLWGASTQSAGVDSGIGAATAKAAMDITGFPGGFIEWTYNCDHPCLMANATVV